MTNNQTSLEINNSRKELPRYGKRINVGAYELPFSGVGEEFEPLGIVPGSSGIVLHETGYIAENYKWDFPNVYSPFWRIYYNYKQGHSVRFGNEIISIKPKQIMVIPNHQRFDCIGDTTVPTLWFQFSCAWQIDPYQKMPIIIPVDSISSAFIKEWPGLFGNKSKNWRDQIYKYSISFILYILAKNEIQWQRPMPSGIISVIGVINTEPGRKWLNRELAKIAIMSTEKFIRTFRKWMNCTPGRYLTEVRLREASILLSRSEKSIENISDLTGFSDRFHFSRIFRNHTGLTPVKYRKLHKK